MRLTEPQRELIERVVDALSLRARARERPTPREIRDTERVMSMVRDLPDGVRRLRSDFNGKRLSPNQQLPNIEPEID